MHCKTCDGTGYVLDKLVIAMTGGLAGIFGWLASDGDAKKDLHKQKCGRCKGSGVEP